MACSTEPGRRGSAWVPPREGFQRETASGFPPRCRQRQTLHCLWSETLLHRLWSEPLLHRLWSEPLLHRLWSEPRSFRSRPFPARSVAPQWGAADAEIMLCSVSSHVLTNILPLKPGVGLNIAMLVSPAARLSPPPLCPQSPPSWSIHLHIFPNPLSTF